jgi:phenylalanyl-tRNA synthetase beta chain
MPNITVVRAELFEAIGQVYTDEEFDELCFEFGVEVDNVMTQVVEYTGDGSKSEEVVYIIAIPANRYDLLCLEGFVRALRVFLEMEKSPVFKRVISPTPQKMVVEASTGQIRPYVACAVLRGVTFDKKIYKSFIDLQEKLHQNICRKRTYVAIGTHDLDTLSGPFRYRAAAPEDINFVPLTEDNGKVYNGKELLDFYRENQSVKHLKPYTDIIYHSPVYPVITDSTGQVLSLPPIINGKHSRIQMHTKNIFIECTGTDLTKANIVLDTVVTMFSEYCSEPFTYEQVEVTYEATGETQLSPVMSERKCEAKATEVNGTIGIDISPEQMCAYCERMQLGPAVYNKDSDMVSVTVPPTRSDILHAVDVIEDIAIAYGYNNIVQEVPKTLTVGGPLAINQFTDLLRAEISREGYVEMLTHGLCSTAENFTSLRRPVGPAVSLANPANIEYEVVRTTLIPGALKTLSFNKGVSHKDGIKLFEISDVVLPAVNEIGAMNARRLLGLYSSFSSSLEMVHGLMDRVMAASQIAPEDVYARSSLTADDISSLARVARTGVCYGVRTSADELYFPGMRADVVLINNATKVETVIGSMGVVHPEVLSNFEITYPCSVVELDLDAMMNAGL